MYCVWCVPDIAGHQNLFQYNWNEALKQNIFSDIFIFHFGRKGVTDLPLDFRTLMGTPRTVEIVNVGNGKYWYNGIGKNLQLIFSRLNKNIIIQLNFNMDGLPIFNSSRRVFWPILCSIHRECCKHACMKINTLNYVASMKWFWSKLVLCFFRNASYSTDDYFNLVWHS